jgi:hypothetical protein
MQCYLLDENKNPYPVGMEEGLKLYDNPEMKIIQQDYVGDIFVSTVFLGFDHRFFSDEEDTKPVLFETMIFGGEYNQFQKRYTTYEDALVNHNIMLQKVKDSVTKKPDA